MLNYVCNQCKDTGYKPLSDQPANGITAPCGYCYAYFSKDWIKAEWLKQVKAIK